MNNGTRNVLALIFGSVVAFVCAEIGLRTYQALFRDTGFFSWFVGYQHTTRFPLSPFLVFGPRMNEQLQGKRRPADAYFNHQGFRTTDTLGAKPAGQFRVIALGGSTTADITNEEGIHWPLVAEDSLRAWGRTDVRVYNAAMSAYSSAHSLVRLQFDLLQYHPDMIVVMHNINDLSVNYFAWHANEPVDANYRIKYGTRGYTGVVDQRDVVMSRVWHSASRRVADLLAPPRATPSWDYSIDAGRALFKRNLANIVAVARANGVGVILLTMPLCDDPAASVCTARGEGDPVYFPPDFSRFLRDFDSYNAAIRETGAELGVGVVDLRTSVRRDTTLWLDVVHHTTAGVREVGFRAAQGMLPLLPSMRRAPD